MPGSVSLGTVHVALEMRLQKFKDGLRDATRDLNRFETETTRRAEKISHSLSSLGRNMSIGVTAPLVLMGKAAVDSAVRMDSLRRSLDSLTGNSKETEKQLVRLREAAKMPGLGFRELIEGSVRLQSAGLSARQAEGALKAFGNAVALAGGSKDDLREVGVQLAQIASSGKLQGDELRIIAERVPQVRAVLKEAFGTASSEEIMKFGLSVDEILTKITDGLNNLPTASDSVQNKFDNLNDTIDDLKRTVGNAFLPAVIEGLESISEATESATNWFNSLGPAAQQGLAKLAIGGAVMGPALLGLAALSGWFSKISTSPFFKWLIASAKTPAAKAGGPLALGLGLMPETHYQKMMREYPEDLVPILPGIPASILGRPRPPVAKPVADQMLRDEQAANAMRGMTYDPFTGKIRKMIPPVTAAEKAAIAEQIRKGKKAADAAQKRGEFAEEFAQRVPLEVLQSTPGRQFRYMLRQAEQERKDALASGARQVDVDKIILAKRKEIWRMYEEWQAERQNKILDREAKISTARQEFIAKGGQLGWMAGSQMGEIPSLPRNPRLTRNMGGVSAGGGRWLSDFRNFLSGGGPQAEGLAPAQIEAGQEMARTMEQLSEAERQRAIDALLPAFKKPDALFGDEMLRELKPKIQPFTFALGQELGSNLAMEMGREFAGAMDSVFGTKSPLARALSRTFGHLVDDLLNALIQRAIGNKLMIALFGGGGGVAAGGAAIASAGGAAAAGTAGGAAGAAGGAGASAGAAYGTQFALSAIAVIGAYFAAAEILKGIFPGTPQGKATVRRLGGGQAVMDAIKLRTTGYVMPGFESLFGQTSRGANVNVYFDNAQFNNDQDPQRVADTLAWHTRQKLASRPGYG